MYLGTGIDGPTDRAVRVVPMIMAILISRPLARVTSTTAVALARLSVSRRDLGTDGTLERPVSDNPAISPAGFCRGESPRSNTPG